MAKEIQQEIPRKKEPLEIAGEKFMAVLENAKALKVEKSKIEAALINAMKKVMKIFKLMDPGMAASIHIKKNIIIAPGQPPEQFELIIMRPQFHLHINVN